MTNGFRVTGIAAGASFNQLSNLTAVTIPGSVTNIGNFAFGQCTSLTNLILGNGVITIGANAFAHGSA